MKTAMDKAVHDVLELRGIHLAVGRLHEDLGHDAHKEGLNLLKALDAVMEVEDLAAAGYLLPYRLGHDFRVELLNHGLDRLPVIGGRVEDRHVAYLEEGHMEGPRYGRGR